MITLTDHLIEHFSNVIHEYTLPKCSNCPIPYFCCASHYCEEAQKYALSDYGIDISPLRTNHPKLPFMSDKGCVVPHHLKPICTIHLCERQVDEKYLRLRNILSYLIVRRSRSNPNSRVKVLVE